MAEPIQAVETEPQYLNNAEILGVEPDNFLEIMDRPATFLTGEMYGARDRRNTQDGDWTSKTLTWEQWIEGHDKTANASAWGLSRHPVGKDKAGASFVLGSSIGGARRAKAMDTMHAVGIDVDSGAKLDDVLDKLEELGIFCCVYTSYNHGKTGLELKRDEVLRKLGIKTDPTDGEIHQYLREFNKNRYEESFIEGCTIAAQKHQTTEGVKIVLDTPALDLWEDKITGLARNVLGIHFDTSCTDPSRLFYTARHPKGSDEWYCAVIQGKPLVFEDIDEMKKSKYAANRDGGNVFTQAGVNDNHHPPQCYTPSGLNLIEWNRHAGQNFLMTNLIEDVCIDKVRGSNGDKLEIECPFEHNHGQTGGTACFVMNSIDSNTEHWIWKCHHDGCQMHHRLTFLEEALRAGWFDEELLHDEAYLLEGPDQIEDDAEGPDGPSSDIVTANPLDAIYDARLVNPDGFLREPQDAVPLYKEYGIKAPKTETDENADKLDKLDKLDKAYRQMGLTARASHCPLTRKRTMTPPTTPRLSKSSSTPINNHAAFACKRCIGGGVSRPDRSYHRR